MIVNVGHKRTLDLGVEVPSTELGPVASNEMWDEIYERIVQLVNAHRSTLVFVNTRRLAERICPSTRRAAGRGKRSGASRQPVAQAASGGGAQAERRPDKGAGRDRFARTWH